MGGALDQRRLLRLILMTFASGVSVAAVLIALIWIRAFVTHAIVTRAVIAFLVGLEIAYAVAALLLLLVASCCGVVFYRATRKGSGSLLAARGLLLCAGSLIAIGSAETAVALRRPWTVRAPGSATADPELPERFAEPNESPGVTLAVLGESSAYGIPFNDWFSVGKIVTWQLGEAMPGQKFHLELLALPGDTLQIQYAKLARLSRRPDAIIVYCGHNEFAAGVPWSRTVDHYLDEKPSILWRANALAVKVSPLCRFLSETADRFRASLAPPRYLRPPLVDGPGYTPAEYATRLADFRRRLGAIVSYSQRIGAIPILVVPPSNDARFEPNRSFLRAETTLAERKAFARAFVAARSLENTSPERAIESYRSLLASQPGFAETHYRLGCVLEKSGAWDEAYEHFVSARDLDGMPMRILTSFQDAYREVAARYGCAIVDGQALFHAIGTHGLLDDHLFVDAMHPSLRGHIALAQGIVDALHARRAFGWPTAARSPKIEIAACAEHFELRAKDWKTIAERGYMFQLGTAPLRYDPSQRHAKMRAFEAAVKRLAAGEAPESVGLPNMGVPSAPPRRPEPATTDLSIPGVNVPGRQGPAEQPEQQWK